MPNYDVIVVGAGNAALAASVSARNAGAARVLVLEKAPEEMRGGNTYYSGGLLRIAFDSVDQILRLVPKAQELAGFVEGVEAYPRDAFWSDLRRMTSNRTDPELAEILIANSFDTAAWMVDQGIRFEPAISLGAVRVGNLIKWPKGAIVRAVHEGVGLSRMWFAAAQRKGVEIRYGTPAIRLTQDNRGRVTGVVARDAGGVHELSASAVVLGCGGFEANAAWRAQYLGRPWDHAKVRGTPHNQADGLRMAFEIGAMPWGQWSGCHATPINAEAPAFGDRQLTDKTNRLSYPYGVMINRLGLRFVDEGEDQALFTYAKFGGIILNQPGGVAWQIFDAKVKHLLEPRYSTSDPITAASLEELARMLDCDRETATCTLGEYNAAAGHGSFNPGDRDGLTTRGLALPKSNWAQTLDTPPFLAWLVTGGITFSFGGLKVNDRAQVVGTDWTPIAGLYTCGEMVGGLFHHNYPGGSGLMSGAVFGRIAGANAARDRASTAPPHAYGTNSMRQIGLRAVFMRGGTSKAVMFRAADLPRDSEQWTPIFLGVIGSPDANGRQLDGMGGGVSSLSKVCVVGAPTRPDADVDYTFAQVSVTSAAVDYSGNCGNMSSAVGPFAVDEGLVVSAGNDAIVRIHNTNTGKIIVSHFELDEGRAAVDGDFALPGVAGTGAAVRLEFLDPGGAGTGRLLPTGNVVDRLEVAGFGAVEASMIDAANPCVFVAAEALGMTGIEMPDALDANHDLLERLEAIRVAASLRMGIARTAAEAASKPSIPKIAMVTGPREARTLAGDLIAADGADLTVRMISIGQPHRAVPLTGAMCLAVASRLPGSLAHRVARIPRSPDEPVRIAQPSGLTVVGAAVRRSDDGWFADQATVYRTARRLMEGVVFVRATALSRPRNS